MQIQVNAADKETRNIDPEMVEAEVRSALERFEERITRVEVHVRDVNGPKEGDDDKHCTMEARIGGLDPMAVTADGPDAMAAVAAAAAKLQRKIQSDLERRSERR
jgi:ribosome-associated translation inhibitor RaiA